MRQLRPFAVKPVSRGHGFTTHPPKTPSTEFTVNSFSYVETGAGAPWGIRVSQIVLFNKQNKRVLLLGTTTVACEAICYGTCFTPEMTRFSFF